MQASLVTAAYPIAPGSHAGQGLKNPRTIAHGSNGFLQRLALVAAVRDLQVVLALIHEAALRGCSWMKSLPSSSCSRYTLMTKSRCTRALTISFAASSGSRRGLFKRCHVHHAVHIGEPISTIGRCSLKSARARSLFSVLLKSHGAHRGGQCTSGPRPLQARELDRAYPRES